MKRALPLLAASAGVVVGRILTWPIRAHRGLRAGLVLGVSAAGFIAGRSLAGSRRARGRRGLRRLRR